MAQPARAGQDAGMATERSTFLLDETQIPTQWYNVVPDLPAPPPPPLHPGTREPVGPDDLAPLFPMALIEQEVTAERYVDIPGGVLDVYRIWRPSPAGPGAPAGEAARHPGQDLLQVRRRQPGRLAQAEHRGAAGLLQPPGGRHPADHRDRRRPVGHRAGVRHRAVRHGVRGLAGAVVVRPEARPAHDDGDLRRDAAPEPVRPHRGRPLGARRAPRLHRVAGHRDLRGGRGGPAARGHPLRARLGAQPRAAAPDRDRPGGAAAAGDGRGGARRASSAAPAAAPTSAGSRSRSSARSWPAGWTRSSAASSRRPARR